MYNTNRLRERTETDAWGRHTVTVWRIWWESIKVLFAGKHHLLASWKQQIKINQIKHDSEALFLFPKNCWISFHLLQFLWLLLPDHEPFENKTGLLSANSLSLGIQVENKSISIYICANACVRQHFRSHSSHALHLKCNSISALHKLMTSAFRGFLWIQQRGGRKMTTNYLAHKLKSQ